MKINEKNLRVFATSPPFDKQGFLNKRGDVNKYFQRRYFVLKGNLLFYFEKQGDKEPLGLIIVEGCTIGAEYEKQINQRNYILKKFQSLQSYLKTMISIVLRLLLMGIEPMFCQLILKKIWNPG